MTVELNGGRPTMAEREEALDRMYRPWLYAPEKPVRKLHRQGVINKVWDVAKGAVGPSPYGGPEPCAPPTYYTIYWSERCDLTLLGGVRPFNGVVYSPMGTHEAVYFWQSNDFQCKWRCWAIWARPSATPWPCEAVCAPEVIEDE